MRTALIVVTFLATLGIVSSRNTPVTTATDYDKARNICRAFHDFCARQDAVTPEMMK